MVRYPLPAFRPAILPVAMRRATILGDTCKISAAMAVSMIRFSIQPPITATATMAASTLIARIAIPAACCLVIACSYGQQRGDPPQ